MSAHRFLFERSSVALINRHFNEHQIVVYRPPGGQEPFTLDAAIGNREYYDEQVTGGDFKIEKLRIRLLTADMKANGVDQIQGAATVQLNDEEWNLSFNECQYGTHYTLLVLVRKILYRRNQMRKI